MLPKPIKPGERRPSPVRNIEREWVEQIAAELNCKPEIHEILRAISYLRQCSAMNDDIPF